MKFVYEFMKMKRQAVLILGCLFAFMLVSAVCSAENITVGVYQNSPKIFKNDSGKPSGLFVELLNEISKREDWFLNYVSCEWSECLKSLEEGRIDLMPDVAYSEERDKVFDFHQLPVVESWSQVYSDSKVPISRMSDLNDKRIALLSGSIQEKELQKRISMSVYNITIVPAETYAQAFKLVADGSADAVISNHFFGDYFYRDFNLTKTPIVFNVVPLYFATAQGKNAELLNAIDKYLSVWIKEANSPYYQTLHHWSEKPDKKIVPEFVFWIAAICAILLLFSAGMIMLLRAQVRARTRHLEIANEELKIHRENLEDLVAERTSELEKIQEQLVRVQKMEAVGELAGGISHNFNNMLAIILGTAEVVLKCVSDGDPNRGRVERIIKTGIRAKDITGRLLTFARKEHLEIRSVSAQTLLADMVEMLKSAINLNIEIISSAPEEDIILKGDTNLLVQALMNIAFNACDAMKNGGTLTLEADSITVQNSSPHVLHGFLKSGEYCIIKISDIGSGMTPPVVRRIFEPFFTTKEKGEGTGLGLSVTEGIVKMHEGFIEVESEPGQGTTMLVYLPRVMDYSPHDENMSSQAKNCGNKEVILIVDDEIDFTEMMCDFLELSNFKTLTANSGEEAVEIYKKNFEDISLVILDIMMPGMDGEVVYDALREMNDDVKVIICSGFSVKGKAGEIMSKGATAFLQKPFAPENLLDCILGIIENNNTAAV